MWDTSAAWCSNRIDSLPMCPILLVTAGLWTIWKGNVWILGIPLERLRGRMTCTIQRIRDFIRFIVYWIRLAWLLKIFCANSFSCFGLNITKIYFGTSSCVLLMARRSSATPCGKNNEQVKVTPIIAAQSVEFCSENIMGIYKLEAGIVHAKPEVNLVYLSTRHTKAAASAFASPKA